MRHKSRVRLERQRRAYDLRMQGVVLVPRPPRLPKAPNRCAKQPHEELMRRALAEKEARDGHNIPGHL